MMKKILEVGDVLRTRFDSDLYGGQDLIIVRITSEDGKTFYPHLDVSSPQTPDTILDGWVHFKHEKLVAGAKHFKAKVWWAQEECVRVFSKDEISLMLYFETCLVDTYGGKVQGARMNESDMKIAEKFERLGLIQFERIPFREMERLRKKLDMAVPYTHTVRFIDEDAWTLVYKWRRERAERVVQKW